MTVHPEVSAECAELLEIAAVIGTAFDVDVLATVAGLETLSCLDALGEARRLGLIEPDAGPERHRFTDPTVHAEVLGGLPASRRVQLHARVAEAIGTIYADRLDGHLLELAAHWSAAAVGDYRRPATRWVLRAAEASLANGDHDEAARLFRRALDIGRDALDVDEHCRLLLGLAVAAYRGFDVGAALGACTEATALAADAGRADLQAEAALVVEPTIVAEVNVALRRLCEAALVVVSTDDVATRVRLTARIADVSHYLGDRTAGHAACEELERLAAGCTDLRAVATALHARQLDASGPDGVEERERLAAELSDVARRSGDPAESVWAQLWRVDAALQRGALAQAQRELDAALRVGSQCSDAIVRWQLVRARATMAQAQARYDDAARLADDAAQILGAIGNPLGHLIWGAQQATIRYHTGIDTEFAAALGLADDATPPPLVAGAVQVLTDVVVLAATGREQRAAALYRSLGPATQWQLQPHAELFTWAFGVVAAVALDERDDVAQFLARLDDHRGWHVAAGAGCIAYFGPVELWLGVGAAHLGRVDDAISDLAQSAELCAANGAAGFLAQSQVELARVHARRGGPGDMRRARALATEGARRADLLGMPQVASAARTLAGPSGGSAPDGLTRREQQVAELVAEGLSNRAIAQRLYLSERTAANHVQHILDKLGLANRSQIVAWLTARK